MSGDIQTIGAPALYPAWREAVRQLREAGRIRPGEIITRDELEAIFGIRPALTIAQHEQNRLRFLQQFSEMRAALLQDHCAMLRPVSGQGWEIVPPGEQTSRAMDDRMRNIHKQIKHLAQEVSHVRTDMLTASEQAENANARAKVGQLAAMLGARIDGRAQVEARLTHGGADD